MIFEDPSGVMFDTRNLDYGIIWEKLGLSERDKVAARRVVAFYDEVNMKDFYEAPMDMSESMKTQNRRLLRHQADHYRTQNELERVAGSKRIVRKLIKNRVLMLHRKCLRLDNQNHPQAPYRLNGSYLRELDS